MKKTIKNVLCLVLCALSIFAFAGCSGTQTKEIDIEKLANDLMEQVQFKDTLTKLDDDMISKLYGIDYAEEQIVYISTGATAEEIALFKLKDESDAQKAYDAVNKRLDYQKSSFELYIPEEMVKLDAAVVELYGNYVIFCVSDGDTAKTVIDGYIK